MALSRIFRPQLSRREFAALSCAAALSGLDLPEASATAPAEGSVCMIIRHGEKPDGSGNPPGIDEKGQQDPHSLTRRGWDRARALGQFFASPEAGVVRPARIYAPGEAAGRAEGRRPRQTAGPIAEALGIGVGLEHREGQEKELANQLSVLGPNSPALVVWEHSAIPDIVGHLDGPVRPKVKSWPDGRYDVVLVCRADKSGWELAQVPELVLPGDSSSPL